jgi:CheY-like chemotaxis protein
VLVAQDGLAALDMATMGTVDLVVTDLNLPGQDGFQLTVDLKRRRADLPVVAVTGYDNPAHLEGARRAGADAVIVKPVDPQALAALLLRLLTGAGESLDPADAHSRRPGGVLAVAARAGDLELGCAGALLDHAAAGRSVQVLIMDGTGDLAEAAARLGGTLLGEPGTDAYDPLRTLDTAVRLGAPSQAYLPSPRDDNPQRAALYDTARDALQGVPSVLGYATTTTKLDFRPEIFADVTAHLDAKHQALEALAANGVPSLPPPDFARAHAQYWGRVRAFRPVEPFEILRDATRR